MKLRQARKIWARNITRLPLYRHSTFGRAVNRMVRMVRRRGRWTPTPEMRRDIRYTIQALILQCARG